MWWPHPDSLSDLKVEDAEEGWDLSAPDDTECGAWLSYFSQSEEHRAFFERNFVGTLIQHCEYLEKNGKV